MSAITINLPAEKALNAQRVFSNNRHSNKISWKRKEAFELAGTVKEYLKQFDIILPDAKKDFKNRREEVLLYDLYDKELDNHFGELIKLYYDLKTCNKGIYAIFNDDKRISTQLLSCWYSKNRVDPVWNYRKSKLVRNLWYSFLKESSIHKKYTPIHLVLTVPHKNGLWKDKRFYGQELIAAFNALRKDKLFKKYIYGGEYGVECKPSSDRNGMHIHIHSLLFQHPKYKIKEVRNYLASRWKELVGNESGYSGIHYEQLYCYKRDEAGKFIMEDKECITGTMEVQEQQEDYTYEAVMEQKQTRKKFRISQDSPLEDYLNGVMECIKYHFKPDCLQKQDGSYDVELICEVLNNTKNSRLYSRFGALYNEPKLSFSQKKDKQPEDEPREEVIMGSLNGVIEGLINPLTFMPAKENEFRLAISCPEFLSHRPKDFIKPCEPIINCMDAFYFLDKDVSLNQAMALLAKGQFYKMLDYDSFNRFRAFEQTG